MSNRTSEDFLDNECSFEKGAEIKEALFICKKYSENLPYPVVVVDSDGIIVYKNSKIKYINFKWRVGARVKHYIGAISFAALRSLKHGSHVVIPNCGVGAVGIKIDEYYFIVFIPSFEINDSFAEIIYEYIGSIPETDFFEKRGLGTNDTFPDDQVKNWNKFKKDFEKFYSKRCMYALKTAHLFVKEDVEKTHNIISALDEIAGIVNEDISGFGYKIKRKSMSATEECVVSATSADLCAVISITLFLCARCASSCKAVVEIEMIKNREMSVDEICFSVKSDMTLKGFKEKFDIDFYHDERALYFQTIRHLASKYFWGFETHKDDSSLHFVLMLPRISPDRSALSDVCLQNSKIVGELFLEFFGIGPDKE